MLSYQHIYHAGCLADIHKHAALCALLDIMVQKDKLFTYIETHAGRGLYDLNAPEAQKTGEAAIGIGRAISQKWFADNQPYARAVSSLQQKYGKNIYPGSAALARHILRPEDKMHLMEMHPQEFQFLKQSMKALGISLYQKDGYENLRAITPPTPRRGIVFIDPSYEIKNEYQTIPKVISKLIKKWPVAVICIWYPLLPAALHVKMIQDLQSLNLPKSAVFEIDFTKGGEEKKGMYGSGLFIANMPFGTEDAVIKIQKILKEKS